MFLRLAISLPKISRQIDEIDVHDPDGQVDESGQEPRSCAASHITTGCC